MAHAVQLHASEQRRMFSSGPA